MAGVSEKVAFEHRPGEPKEFIEAGSQAVADCGIAVGLACPRSGEMVSKPGAGEHGGWVVAMKLGVS